MSLALRAIVKLTLKSALRSHVFQALLFLLFLGVLLVPNTVKGDGTAYGFIQVSIDYSLWIISVILSMSALWVGCSVMCADIEGGQLHMVVAKPVSRITVFCGKLLGVLILHAILMLIASGAAYGFVMLQFSWQKFSPTEKARVEAEVLTGRRSYLPDMPDMEAMVREKFEQRAKASVNNTGKPFEQLPPSEKTRMLLEVRKQVMASLGEILPGPDNAKFWNYSGLPSDYKGPICVRYKLYSGSPDSKDQKTSYGLWLLRVFVPDSAIANATEKPKATANATDTQRMTEIYVQKTPDPERIVCGVPLEFQIPSSSTLKDGTVRLGLANFDPEGKTLFIQASDGPKLLLKSSSFLDNFLRAVFVSFLRVVVLAGLACAAGAIFSMPVAVFMVIAYIAIGFFASFLIGTEQTYGANPSADFMEKFGLFASKTVMIGVMPLQRFEVSDKLANGELVEFSFIAKLIFDCLVLKWLPLCALGAWLYWRRELAMALKR